MSGTTGGRVAPTIRLTICIDGSHASRRPMPDAEYRQQFRDSHVRRIHDAACRAGPDGAARSIYLKGPNAFGTDIDAIFLQALDFIAFHAGPASLRLTFCGYSRGGAIALDLANAFARPPEQRGVLAQRLSFGMSQRTITRIEEVRAALAAGSGVERLVMFDAVGMSDLVQGQPVAAGIGQVAHVIRSAAWGSRRGWRNVGIELAAGSPPRAAFPVRQLNGTHAALGGLPATGDLPKPLVDDLLASRAVTAEHWAAAERRWRGDMPMSHLVCAAIGMPGRFVHPLDGTLLDAGARRALEFAGKVVFGSAAAPAWLPSLRATLQACQQDGGLGRSARAMQFGLALTLPGKDAFECLEIFFVGCRPARQLIDRYARLDEQASRQAWRMIEAQAGPFTAAAGR